MAEIGRKLVIQNILLVFDAKVLLFPNFFQISRQYVVFNILHINSYFVIIIVVKSVSRMSNNVNVTSWQHRIKKQHLARIALGISE